MQNIYHILSLGLLVAGSRQFLATVFFISFILKIGLLALLFIKQKKIKKLRRSFIFLVVMLMGSILEDSSWLSVLTIDWITPNSNLPLFIIILVRTWLRIAWAFNVIQYQATALFIESLVCNNHKINLWQKFCMVITTCFVLSFILGLPILFGFTSSFYEYKMQEFAALYELVPLMIPTFFIAIKNLRSGKLPIILSNQIKTLIVMVMIPSWVFALLSVTPFNFRTIAISNDYTLTSLCNIFITFALFYGVRRIIGLRFLNLQDHIAAPATLNKVSFFLNFKTALSRLSTATTINELQHIVQLFFKENFDISLSSASLYLRNTKEHPPHSQEQGKVAQLVEGFINTAPINLIDTMRAEKIFIHDEIAFTHFYEESITTRTILDFVVALHVDIFIPIFDKNLLLGYITITRDSRRGIFYNDIERDQMLVFVGYLGNLIYLIEHQNLDALLQQDAELKQDLYQKHHEILQYKESIRSFMRSTRSSNIGIIFYKSRQLVFGNKEAEEIIKVNPNTYPAHYLIKDLKQVAHQVHTYKSAHRIFSKDHEGNTLVLAAVPNLEHNNVIITVFYPEVSDIIKRQIDFLHDPSEWDYLLYLETTQSGKLINQLIPGSGEQLLNFKIDILKAALGAKAIWLDVPEQDLHAIVNLLHHLSLREQVFTLELHHPIVTTQIGAQIFGINPIFGKNRNPALLEQLDKSGTLHIKNIHYLDMESQENLAEYLRLGFFKILHSDRRIASAARVIVSSPLNLIHLAQEGKFSRNLCAELRKTKLSLPQLSSLSFEELYALAEGFSQQIIRNKTYKSLMELNTTEKHKLYDGKPTSLQELRIKVQHLLNKKTERSPLEVPPSPAEIQEQTDQELLTAARMGKQALKDPRIMAILWNKFKCQNKIATFLSVNRSSVSRRCHEYKLVSKE